MLRGRRPPLHVITPALGTAGFTVSVAARLVMLPTGLVTTTVKVAPLSVVVSAGVV